MSSQPWMPLYPSDYLADTMDLTTEQHGVYFKLILIAWQRGGPIPNEKEFLKRIFRDMHGHTFNRLIPPILDRFFSLDDDGNWRQKRVDQELEKAGRISEKRRQNAGKRWANDPQKSRKSPANPPQTAPDLLNSNGLGDASRARSTTTTTVQKLPLLNGGAVREPADIDPMIAYWRECTASLMALLDKPEAGAKAVLGRMLKAAGNDSEQVQAAIKAAEWERPADPLPWMIARLKAKGKPQSGQRSLLDAADAIINR